MKTSKFGSTPFVALFEVVTLALFFVWMPEAASAAPTPIASCPAVISAPGTYRLDVDCMVGSSAGYAISIAANNVNLNLDGHVLAGPISTSADCGLDVLGIEINGSNVTINNGVLIRFRLGIRAFFGQGHNMSNLTVMGNCGGIQLFHSNKNVIAGSSLSGNYNSGVQFVNANGNRLSNSLVNNNGSVTLGGNHGIFLENSSSNVINGNEVSANRNARGIRLISSNDNEIRNNTIIGNSEEGIRIDDDGSNRNVMRANRAIFNGIDFGDSNPMCINEWTNNTFYTDNEGDGPGAGCIQ